MHGINVNLTQSCTNVSKLNFISKNSEDKIMVRGYSLLGYDKNSLINKDYEDVLYLLFYKKLPNVTEKLKLKKIIGSAYDIDYSLQFKLITKCIKIFEDHPLNLIEIILLSLNTLEDNKELEYTKLFIQCFVVCINCFNAYIGKELKIPNKNLSIIENWLYLIGKDYKNQKLVENFSKMLIAWMECYLPSSTISARLNISARPDFISCVVSGFINCTGKKHTSARIECAKFLLELEKEINNFDIKLTDISKFKKFLKNKIQKKIDDKELIYGFGHYVFKGLDENSYDPRIYIIKNAIKDIYPNSIYLRITEIIVEMFKDGDFRKNSMEFKLPPNSDIFWASFLLDFMKDYDRIPVELISLFTILTRLSGIIAHCDEQLLEHNPIRVVEMN